MHELMTWITEPSQQFRLPRGGVVDQTKPLPFIFDGRKLVGYAGDTLASALLANGIRLVGRSFKYHRPRGIFSASSEEPNALVELRRGTRREPNTKATVIELFRGLEATSQNCWPSLTFDVLAANQLLSRFLAAGFYYKTFMWPASFWEKLYEPIIRRSAGLGRPPENADPDQYEKAFAFCDLLVIGSGPSGLMAALAAARSDARVILCDEDFQFGGRLMSERRSIDDMDGVDWVARIVAELKSFPEVLLMPRTTVVGAYDGGTYAALERVSDHFTVPPAHLPRQRFWRIVAKRTVIASGAIERPIAFGNNDRPGVMLASAVRTYANRFAVAAGRRIAVFTNNDDGWRTASDATVAGMEVAAIVDVRPVVGERLRKLAPAGCKILVGAVVREVAGRGCVTGITVQADNKTHSISIDGLAVSGGWNPALGLTSHLGTRPVWRDDISAFVPGGPLTCGMAVAGAVNGTFSLAGALAEGAEAGADAAEKLGFKKTRLPVPRADDDSTEIAPFWYVPQSHAKAFVDFQHDVTVDDIKLAVREGFRSVEHLKRYTTLGMGTEQGKIANVNGLAILAELTRRSIPQTGTTVFRPPYIPVAIGAFAGQHRERNFRPLRLTPSHAWAKEQGATFVETGLWLRAQWFSRQQDRDWRETVSREVSSVRAGVGICDVSTLGKIDIQGPDAGIFLDRVYTNTFSTLPVGKARYGLMLREDGIAMDDGTTSRIAENHYFMTTTTANAARIMQHLEFCSQVLWPSLDVQMVSVTEQWAQYSIAGPRARDTLRKIIDAEHDIANEAIPYLAVSELTVCGGIKARLFRISFSGELAYEISVPARYGDSIARALMAAGAPFGIVCYGTEALGVMRIEKGHPAGNELNGQTTARDLGLARMMSGKKDYIGRIMADRPGLRDPDRPTLVGLMPVNRVQPLHVGAHFVGLERPASGENDEGYMTSVAYSPTLGHSIGLGLLRHGPARFGERLRACDPVRGGDVEIEVCNPVFVDPEGVRLRV